MTVKEMFRILKRDNAADRAELAEAAGVSRQTLCKMSARNDMKLSTLRKIIESQGYSLLLSDGICSYEFTEEETEDFD